VKINQIIELIKERMDPDELIDVLNLSITDLTGILETFIEDKQEEFEDLFFRYGDNE